MSRYATRMSLLLATLLLLLGKTCEGLGNLVETQWWETTLVYEISPSAYQDSDGDGHGDLQGIISRLDYIQELGVETICLNPIYPSPLIDSGYDISDYKNIHPIFGNLSDFDELLEEAHERDMKVILDVVPNHSSDQHEWFNSSIERIDPYTDFYVWANGTELENGTREPPNNWTSNWDDEDDSAWTWNDQRDQWYYHAFHESQPDLQLENEDVRREIMLVLDFWLDRGVDGFRISGIPHFFEDPELGPEKNVEFLSEIRELVDAWTELSNSSSKLLVAGSCDTEINSLSYYGSDNKPGILPLNCRFIADVNLNDSSVNASQVEAAIEDWLALLPLNASTNWPLSKNDHSRISSRVGSEKLDALHMLSMLLPGQAFTYYGDEIGMLDTPVLSNEIDETYATRSGYAEMTSRDSARNPMQWDDSVSAGFSTNENTYIPVNDDYYETNVEDQLENPNSHLNVYKAIAQLRKDPVFARGHCELDSVNDDNVLVMRRTLTGFPAYVVIINLSDDLQRVNVTELYPDLNEELDVVVTSSEDYLNRSTVPRNAINVLPNTGLVLKNQLTSGFDNSTGAQYTDVDTFVPVDEEETTADYYIVEPSTPLFESDEENSTTEEIETTTVSLEETSMSHISSIPSSTTPVPSVEAVTDETTTPCPSPSTGATRSTLQLQLIFGIAIAALASAW